MDAKERKSFTDLNVWEKSRQLANLVYDMTKLFPDGEKFGLVLQLRKSAVSIPSNIAEGNGRQHVKDSVHFYYTARGSLYELETQIIIANDQGFIPDEKFIECINLIAECKKLLNGFINYHKRKLDVEQ